MLHGNTQWTEIFVRHFLFQNQQRAPIDSDDLLFFVRKKYIKESSRSKPKYEDEIEVFLIILLLLSYSIKSPKLSLGFS